jgi:hypothetical protein
MGEYKPMVLGLHRVYEYSWMPLGYVYYSEPASGLGLAGLKPRAKAMRINCIMFYVFWPIWGCDVLFVHKNRNELDAPTMERNGDGHGDR